MVTYKKNKVASQKNQIGTIFVEKIPPKTTTREIWNFFKTGGEILDIILPKKRDRSNNRIGFVKTKKEEIARKVVKGLRSREFLGVKTISQSGGRESKKETIDWRKAFEGNKRNKSRKDTTASQHIDKKEEVEQIKLNSSTQHVLLEPHNGVCFLNSKICFTLFPMDGDILAQVMEELNIENVLVKEITC